MLFDIDFKREKESNIKELNKNKDEPKIQYAMSFVVCKKK